MNELYKELKDTLLLDNRSDNEGINTTKIDTPQQIKLDHAKLKEDAKRSVKHKLEEELTKAEKKLKGREEGE